MNKQAAAAAEASQMASYVLDASVSRVAAGYADAAERTFEEGSFRRAFYNRLHNFWAKETKLRIAHEEKR